MSQSETLNDVNTDASRSMRAKIGSFLQQQGALVMLVLVCIIGFARYEAFLTPENLRTCCVRIRCSDSSRSV